MSSPAPRKTRRKLRIAPALSRQQKTRRYTYLALSFLFALIAILNIASEDLGAKQIAGLILLATLSLASLVAARYIHTHRVEGALQTLGCLADVITLLVLPIALAAAIYAIL